MKCKYIDDDDNDDDDDDDLIACCPGFSGLLPHNASSVAVPVFIIDHLQSPTITAQSMPRVSKRIQHSD